MVLVAFVVPRVASQFVLRFFLQLVLVLVSCHERRVVCLLFKDIAAPMIALVLLPSNQAQPAELMLARCADHDVAAVIFLNRVVTLGAHLRIGHQPHCIIALRILLELPPFSELAVDTLMGELTALEAELCATVADD